MVVLSVIVITAAAVGTYIALDTEDRITVDVDDSVGGTADGGGDYIKGTTVTVIASADRGFVFIGWYDGDVMISSESTYSFMADVPITLSAEFEKAVFTLNIVSNYDGGDVSGGGAYIYGEQAGLTVTPRPGYTFDGWYDGDVIISSETSVEHIVLCDMTVEAKFSIIHDASFSSVSDDGTDEVVFTSTYNVEVVSRIWVISLVSSGEVLHTVTGTDGLHDSISFTIDDWSDVRITHTVTYADSSESFATSETREYTWNYQISSWLWNDHAAKWGMILSLQDYLGYSSFDRNYDRTVENMQSYATLDDSLILELVTEVLDFTSGMSDLLRANFLLKFVQSIPYVYDIDSKGTDEYWNFPYETLWDGQGDCDDHAILYATLMKALGYNVAILILPGHMAVGLSVAGANGTYFETEGVRYYYCETTAIVGGDLRNQYNIGTIPSGYRTAQVFVL